MKEILGPGARSSRTLRPKNLVKLLKDRNADILVAGRQEPVPGDQGGYPFVDVNQERHSAYAGIRGW